MERKKLIIAVVVAIIFLIAIFLPGFSELQKMKEESEDMQKRIKFLQQNNDILKEEIRRMKQEPDYVEKRAREKLGIVKKGEYIYKGNPE